LQGYPFQQKRGGKKVKSKKKWDGLSREKQKYGMGKKKRSLQDRGRMTKERCACLFGRGGGNWSRRSTLTKEWEKKGRGRRGGVGLARRLGEKPYIESKKRKSL